MKKTTVAKEITLTLSTGVRDIDFKFTPTVSDHNNYTNELMPDNKIAPAYTFLTRIVASEQKDALVELLDTIPGLVMELFMEINKAARGGLKVALKN